MGRAEIASQGRPKGQGKLAPHRAFLEELIRQHADITLPKLAAALADATEERRSSHVRKQGQNWEQRRMPTMRSHPERLAFIDETSVKTNLTRQRGRLLCGERLVMDAPFGAWGTQTFIAGLTAYALIAPWVIKEAMPLGECMHSLAGSRWPGLRRSCRKGVGARTGPRHRSRSSHLSQYCCDQTCRSVYRLKD